MVKPGAEDGKRRAENPAASGVVTGLSSERWVRAEVILDGKYRVCGLAGTGAFGMVFEAENIELREKVAIKCLREDWLVDAAMVERFVREARTAATIKSEYVASVYDVGTSPDGVPYIVMEYLDGKDLCTVLETSGTLDPRTAAEYLLQVCDALAVAHAKGIVHRDIKPENLLLTERSGGMPVIKVLDFGISKTPMSGSLVGAEGSPLQTVNAIGTPLYMSPEQVRGAPTVDARSDIWSLGLVLYELLTGERAFDAESIAAIGAAILEVNPLPIELLRTDLPPGFASVLHRCLEKDPAHRFQNVAELALALMPYAPKRTRIHVERAIATLQAAGMVDRSVTLGSSRPPPSSPDDAIPLSIPRPQRLPSDPQVLETPIAMPTPRASQAERDPFAPSESGTRSEPTISVPASRSTPAPPPPRKRRTFVMALVLIAIGAGGSSLARRYEGQLMQLAHEYAPQLVPGTVASGATESSALPPAVSVAPASSASARPAPSLSASAAPRAPAPRKKSR